MYSISLALPAIFLFLCLVCPLNTHNKSIVKKKFTIDQRKVVLVKGRGSDAHVQSLKDVQSVSDLSPFK